MKQRLKGKQRKNPKIGGDTKDQKFIIRATTGSSFLDGKIFSFARPGTRETQHKGGLKWRTHALKRENYSF